MKQMSDNLWCDNKNNVKVWSLILDGVDSACSFSDDFYELFL